MSNLIEHGRHEHCTAPVSVVFQDASRIDVNLKPGEYAVGDSRCRMRTVLGSCVSITLWHPIYRVGAMSHFMLARRDRPRQGASLDARYGDEALLLMLGELHRADMAISQFEAKIFGGGDMFPGQRAAKGRRVGQANGEAARELLLAHRIPVHSESLFGVGHRQIVFDVATGDVWVRQIAAH
jgi:chemotaxis protein CheD